MQTALTVFRLLVTGILLALLGVWTWAFVQGQVTVAPPWYVWLLVGVGSGIITMKDYLKIVRGRDGRGSTDKIH